MKKIILLFMMISFTILNAAPVAPSNGDGTQGNPYQIANLDNLQWLEQNSSVWASGTYFIQTADINASDTVNWNGGKGFSPIGNNTTSFKGKYDGNGTTISNLFINRPDQNQTGFFGSIEDTSGDSTIKIQNINILDANISGNNYVGVLAGYSYLSEISNVNVSGSITATAEQSGGLIGLLMGSPSLGTSSVVNSSADVLVVGAGRVGGLIGETGNYTTISNSYASGDVNSTGSLVGGFIGRSYGSISKSYASGDVIGNGSSSSVGGFIGHNIGNSHYVTTIENSYATGNVSGNAEVGGFLGYCGGASQNTEVEKSYSVGSVNGNSNTNGFIGYFDTKCKPKANLSNKDTSGATTPNGATGISSNDLRKLSLYTETYTPPAYLSEAWDINSSLNHTNEIWILDPAVNDGYPTFTFAHHVPTAEVPNGDGSSGTPWEIATLNNLIWISENYDSLDDSNYSFIQTADTNAYFTKNIDNGQGFAPIGRDNLTLFEGHYDGNESTISNLYINRTNAYIGLFGTIGSDVSIKNLNVIDANIIGNITFSENGLGILVGVATGLSNDTEKVILDNINVSGSLTLNSVDGHFANVGGVIGKAENDVNLSNVESNVSIISNDTTEENNLGGLVGWVHNNNANHHRDHLNYLGSNGSITSISTQEHIGGLIGTMTGNAINPLYDLFIKESYASVDITANSHGATGSVGGFVGRFSETETNVHNSYSRSNITVTDGSSVGGFVGRTTTSIDDVDEKVRVYNSYSATTFSNVAPAGSITGNVEDGNYIMIVDTFWDTNNSSSSAHGGSGGQSYSSSGFTTEELQNKNTYLNHTPQVDEWDFDNIWSISSSQNDGYPTLKWQGLSSLNFEAVGTVNLDEDFGSHVIELNATDDNVSLVPTYGIVDFNSSLVGVTLVGNELNITSVNHINGSVTIEVNASNGTDVETQTITLNIQAINDIPVLSAPITRATTEDINATFTGTFSIDDNDTNESSFIAISTREETYGNFTLDANGSWTYDINNSLASVQALADGEVGSETIIVTSKDGNQTTMLTVNITGVNDAPTFDTNLTNNFTFKEDNDDNISLNFELNVTDVDGDELTITVESNNTSILEINGSSWVDITNYANLEFNLTTVQDAHGLVQVTISVSDDFNTTVQMFDINITAVNDAPTLDNLYDIILWKNFDDTNITLFNNNISSTSNKFSLSNVDVDNNVSELDYNVTDLNTTNVLSSISIDEGIVSLSGVADTSGVTDVNITVSDGDYNVSGTFKVYVSSFEKGDDITNIDAGDYNKTDDVNKTAESVTSKNGNTKIEAIKNKDANATAEHVVTVGASITKSIAEVNATVQLIPEGVKTSFSEGGVDVEVKATAVGQAIHKLTTNSKTVEATFAKAGAQTVIKATKEIETSLVVGAKTIVVKALPDGKALHKVTGDGIVVQVDSEIPGATTTVDASDNIETTVTGENVTGTVKATTFADGTTKVYIKGNSIFSDPTDAFPKENNSTITEENGLLKVKTTFKLNNNDSLDF
jgi:VCBS repeat-containing protein